MTEAVNFQKKKKTPRFKRHDSHKKRIKDKWIKPKGLQAKVRLCKRGFQPLVSIGYKGPSKEHANREGLIVRRVENLKDIEKLDGNKECALISGNVGTRKKIMIIGELRKKNITVDNINAELFLKRIEEEKKKREEGKKKKQTEEQKKKEHEKKPLGKEGKLEERLSDEEKKEQEKKEKDKVLTKREIK